MRDKEPKMKKTINGHRYDTEKADCIVSASSEIADPDDMAYWSESIYRTPRGRWFAAGCGGPMTRYISVVGLSTSGSADIIPLTKEQAKKWLEHYCTDESRAALRFYFDR